MKLWTIQPIEVLQEIEEKGYFICNPQKSKNIDFGNFSTAYNWLITQMNSRIKDKPSNVSYPIWAWHTRDWKHKKPDLRQSGYDTSGTKCVCIEVEIPDKDVLLSDFDAWHFVLNDWWLDDSQNEDEWDYNHNWFDNLPTDKQNELKLNSWQKIFDLTPVDSDWKCNGRYIQATFWKLNKKNITKIQYFTAK